MSGESENHPRAEEALRLLAAATGAARLYPPASALPAEAVAKFTARANEVMNVQGPLRYAIDPEAVRVGETEIAQGNSQVAAFARALHALQVGQVVMAPGLLEAEVTAFVTVVNADPAAVRAAGGPRALLAGARVAHIAVVEVTLRASEEEGLLGVDLMTAPLEDLAGELAASAERWARSTGAGEDDVAAAIGRMEPAARSIAVERLASALMRLDEQTRMKVLGFSLKADVNGRRMDGMLGVIASMKPAALARLLTLVAAQAGTDPRRIAGALELPPETAKLLATFLAPSPTDAPEGDAPLAETPPALEVAEAMQEPADPAEISRLVAIASPDLASGRALSTSVAISRAHPDADTIASIGDSLPQAARDGAFPTVREALRRLDELAATPALMGAVANARATLSDSAVLADICAAVQTDADAAIAGEILHAAGPAGAEALLEAYVRGDEQVRSLLRPVMRGMSDAVLGVARARLRNEDPRRAVAIIKTIGVLGDKRAIPVLSQALSNLNEPVRFAAITALADTPEPEAANALVKALGHPEPETQRFAIREIGRVKAAPAIHQLTRALEDLNPGRTYETRKEVIRALEQIGTPEAERALRRTADRTFVWGRKQKELRAQARRAVQNIRDARTEGAESP